MVTYVRLRPDTVCKSRKTDEGKNLARIDSEPSLRLQPSVDFGGSPANARLEGEGTWTCRQAQRVLDNTKARPAKSQVWRVFTEARQLTHENSRGGKLDWEWRNCLDSMLCVPRNADQSLAVRGWSESTTARWRSDSARPPGQDTIDHAERDPSSFSAAGRWYCGKCRAAGWVA